MLVDIQHSYHNNCLISLVSLFVLFRVMLMYFVLCKFFTGWRIKTNSLTPWSRVLLEKLIVTHLVKKFPAFNGTWRFTTVFTRACQWPLSLPRWNQSTPHPVSLRSILILSSHLELCLPSGLSLYVFQPKYFVLVLFLISPMRATCPAHPILLDLITRITFC
jgi:hypothetical protein